MTELGATVSRHDELMVTCRMEPLTTGNISRRPAVVHKVLRSIVLQTPRSSYSELELDTLSPRYVFKQAMNILKVLLVLKAFYSKESRYSGNIFHVNVL